jgi:hypothetical protein
MCLDVDTKSTKQWHEKYKRTYAGRTIFNCKILFYKFAILDLFLFVLDHES